ncbi:MAG TPA: cupredoxin domain-containing protein [Candidatus Polarisedimenticolia bacterium]|nr:cupredoxin domain-containing protein [Candidatus Polarisedimenticolia bacterium]
MRIRSLASSVLPLAAVALTAALAVAGEPVDEHQTQSKGNAMAAKAVAPGQVKKFYITASEGQIAPDTLHVKQGDHVRITFVSRDGTYGIKFPDFEIKGKVTPEKPAVVEFVPTQKGSFEFRCTRTWGVSHWGKNGTLIVE